MATALARISMLCFAFLLSSCATIMHGTTEEVSINSNPSGADVIIDGSTAGQTPLIKDLKRKNLHLVRIELEGYSPYELRLTRKVSGWVWGNIVFGGLVDLAVDAITGGLYKLDPTVITAELRSAGSASLLQDDQLVILVVLDPDPTWTKIGELKLLPE